MIKKFFQTVLPSVIRPLQIIWNQIIGFVFLVFALVSARSVYRAISEFDGDAESIFRVVLTALFALIMTFFGLMSFWRARKIGKSKPAGS